MKNLKFKKGFTLIELLIVITIIGILAAALLPSILGAPARARDTARIANLQQIVAALETYNSDYGSYPDPDNGCIPSALLQPYFQGGKVPTDPKSLVSSADCAGGKYFYCKITSPAAISYMIAAKMEVQKGNGDYADILSNNCAVTPGVQTKDAYYIQK